MANKEPAKNSDLGLGDRVIQENRTRFLNQDGSFNVRRKGIFEHGSFSLYHAILNMSWTRFITFLAVSYILASAAFTGLYLLCGSTAFAAIQNFGILERAREIFFFSVHVITTIGESSLNPSSLMAKALLSLESMIGLIGLAVIAGLMFARFSNPAVRILFSRHAVIAPYKDITGFMVRIVNGRSNELINLTATITLSMADKDGKRTFQQLDLERDNILVFPLSWTIVHPITKESPLYGLNAEELAKRSPEFLIAISAVDQDLAKTVYARHSYIASEVESGARFANILERMDDGTLIVDPRRIHEIEKIVPTATTPAPVQAKTALKRK
jgi:inward rectifier potassium channel